MVNYTVTIITYFYEKIKRKLGKANKTVWLLQSHTKTPSRFDIREGELNFNHIYFYLSYGLLRQEKLGFFLIVHWYHPNLKFDLEFKH